MATKTKDIIKKFESVTDFENYVSGGKPRGQWKVYQKSREDTEERRKFTTTADFEEADALLKYGDMANFDKLQKAGLQATNAAQIGMKKQRQLYTAVTGHAAHVPNYIAGIPTNMIAQRQVTIKQRVVNIVYSNCYSFDIDAADVIAASVELLNYITHVEASGVRVNLFVCSFVDMKNNGRNAQGAIIKIKESGQYMDLLKTAYPLINPSFLRRHMFRFWEITEDVPFSAGYGYVIMDDDRIKKAVGEAGIEGGLIVNAQHYIKSKDKQAFLKGVFNPEN